MGCLFGSYYVGVDFFFWHAMGVRELLINALLASARALAEWVDVNVAEEDEIVLNGELGPKGAKLLRALADRSERK